MHVVRHVVRFLKVKSSFRRSKVCHMLDLRIYETLDLAFGTLANFNCTSLNIDKQLVVH
jgi:hypothetical protein